MYERSQIGAHDIAWIELVLPNVWLCAPFWAWTYPWPMIGVFLTAILLAITVAGIVYHFLKRREMAKLLKDPCIVHFLILKENESKMDYHAQDSEYHYPDELSLPSNSEKDVVVWMKPRLDLTMSELQFGCIGETGLKPEPLYYVLPWVKRGLIREKHPEKDEDHYVDVTDIYHVVQRDRTWPKDEEKLAGLKMRTKEKGKYSLLIRFVMPGARAEKALTINVT
jgi:hypothetical protein